MMKYSACLLRAGVFLLISTALIPGVQGKETAGPKQAERYLLTINKLKQAFQAYKNVLTAMSGDSALARRFKAEHKRLEQTTDTNGRDSMSMVLARMIEREPRVAEAFRKAGTTPVEAGKAMETVAASLIGVAMLERNGTKAPAPTGSAAENIEFVKKNKTQITAMMEEFAQDIKKLGKLDLEDAEEDK